MLVGMPCKSCGSLSHKSHRSKLCLFYLPPIKKLGKKEGVDTETFVTKTGLRKFCIGAQSAFVYERINQIVLVVSKVMTELSIYLNFYLQKSLALSNGSLDKPNWLHFLYSVQGKKGFHEMDPEYKKLRKRYQFGSYNTSNSHTHVFQEAFRQYETIFMNNVTVHMKKRLIRFFRAFPRPQNTSCLSKKDAILEVAQLLSVDNMDNEFQLNFTKLKSPMCCSALVECGGRA